MRVADVIIKKRDGLELTDEEIRFFVNEMVSGRVEGSQLGAMLMAWYLKGMNARELAVLTNTMTHSGDLLTWPEEWKSLLVDKHSTGGVGDKVSLVLAPAIAACGLKVPMVSGRGLGFTGGTLDKLESISGFTVDLTLEDMRKCLENCGCCIAGQTATLVPADRIMYATRDITGTVEDANFVTASIISKKVAENISALVLDVKVGRASFSKTIDEGRNLANKLVEAAKKQGVRTTAVLTTMDQPVGMAVGNSVEVKEALQALHGNGPDDLMELVLTQGGLLLESAGKARNFTDGREMIMDTIKDGRALKTFEQMLVNQNVKPDIAHELCYGDMDKVLPAARYSSSLIASKTGYVADLDAMAITYVCGALGAARARASDLILPAVGIELKVKVGQYLEKGQVWAQLFREVEEISDFLKNKINGSIVINDEPVASGSRLIEIIH